jgi:hypothetical protein
MQLTRNKQPLIILTTAALLLYGLGVATGWLLRPAGSTGNARQDMAGSGDSARRGISGSSPPSGTEAHAGSHGTSTSVLGAGSNQQREDGTAPGADEALVTKPTTAFENHVKDWIVKEAFENYYSMPHLGHPRKDSFEVNEEFGEILDLSEGEAQELEGILFTHHKTLRALQKAHAVYDDDPDFYGRVVFSPFEEDGKMLRQALEQDLSRLLGPEKMEFLSEYLDERLDDRFDEFGEKQMVYCIKPDEDAGKWQVRREEYEWDEHDKAWEQRGAGWTTTDIGSELSWPYSEYFEIDPNVAELEQRPDSG